MINNDYKTQHEHHESGEGEESKSLFPPKRFTRQFKSYWKRYRNCHTAKPEMTSSAEKSVKGVKSVHNFRLLKVNTLFLKKGGEISLSLKMVNVCPNLSSFLYRVNSCFESSPNSQSIYLGRIWACSHKKNESFPRLSPISHF